MGPLIAAILFTLLGLGALVLVVLGLPGTWVLLGLALFVELADGWWTPGDPHPVTFGWVLLGGMLGLALLGELLEFLSGLLGTKGGGGSRRGMVGALLGGLAGGILATFLLSLPVVGTLLGALLGTFAGAWLGETTGPHPMSGKEAVKPALLATLGRVLGTVAKLGLALVIWLVLSVAAFAGG